MLHLLKYSFLSKVRNFNIIFWPLVFPLVLGTFFYFAFGNINEADFQTVPVAVVKEASADTFFMTYLDEVEKSSPDLLKAEKMSEKELLQYSGILYQIVIHAKYIHIWQAADVRFQEKQWFLCQVKDTKE